MALVKCKECGNEIAKSAKVCPKCGAKNKQTSVVTKVVMGLFVVGVIGAVAGKKEPQSVASSVPAPVSIDSAAEAKAKKEEAARYGVALIGADAIKKALRNPASVEWVDVLVNDDASVACYEYRAQNGFGGMNVEYASLVKGKLSAASAVWNKYCAGKKLFSLTSSVKVALR